MVSSWESKSKDRHIQGSPAMNSSLLEELDSILTQFDEQWRSGTPILDDFVPAPGSPLRHQALIGLIRTDLARRFAAGEAVCVERQYLDRYPELKADVRG